MTLSVDEVRQRNLGVEFDPDGPFRRQDPDGATLSEQGQRPARDLPQRSTRHDTLVAAYAARA